MLKQVHTIPTAADCDAGQASVLEMDSVFQSLSSDLQAQYRGAHDAIMNAYNGEWYWGINWIPFNPQCGTMQELGNQADALTAQMQSAAGQVPVGVGGPATQASQSSILSGLIGGQGTTLLIVGGLVVAYLVLKK